MGRLFLACQSYRMVALVGIEPTLLAELDFESSASTNSATRPMVLTFLQQLFLPSARKYLVCVLAF